MKLSVYLNKPDASLKAPEAEADHKCDLGKWIYREGEKHQALAEFCQLGQMHKKFHPEAAAIIKRADKGDKVSEEVALGAKSPFADASTQVISLLMNLFKS